MNLKKSNFLRLFKYVTGSLLPEIYPELGLQSFRVVRNILIVLKVYKRSFS